MKTVYDTNVVLTCTDNGKEAPAIIDNFKEKKSFDVFLATNKIRMKWNGKVYVGNQFGMEFTSPGPEIFEVKEGRRK